MGLTDSTQPDPADFLHKILEAASENDDDSPDKVHMLIPKDPSQPEMIVHVQSTKDDLVYEKVARQLYQRRMASTREVRALVMFSRRALDPLHHPARSEVQVVYLDEAVQRLIAQRSDHPGIKQLAAILERDRASLQ
jgi:hypothetical protein